MDFRGLDLNLLVALDALLAERNVTRAGGRVHLSQSAMSGALARLRQFFGDDLMVPIGRSMVLTPLALSLIQPVRDVLLQVQATVATKADFDPATSDRRFTIMGSDFVLTTLMADVVPRVVRAAPGVALELRHMDTTGREGLDRGALDFLVVPHVFVADAHPSEPLFEEGYTCLVWAENAEVGDRISFEQYLAAGHVAIAVGESRHPGFEEWLLQHYGYKRRVAVVAPTYAMLPFLVVGTNRIATVPASVAKFSAQYLPLRTLPLPVKIPKRIELLQWPRFQDQDPGSIWLRGVFRDAAARLDPSNRSRAAASAKPKRVGSALR